jgi:aminoglycoside phosphotransferase (APT) family kinase protein
MTIEETAATDVVIDAALVRRLIASQFPHWAHLPLKRLEPAGSDNVIYRLGEAMSIRLPRGDWAAGQAEKEYRWLPRLAPHLPLAIPTPLALGSPAGDYPWHWSVSRWLEGETATIGGLADPQRTATELAGFVNSLQQIAAVEALAPGPHNDFIGEPLACRDRRTRAAIAAVDGTFDSTALTAVWDAALAAPPWDRPPVWFHGDLHTGNLLTVDASRRRPGLRRARGHLSTQGLCSVRGGVWGVVAASFVARQKGWPAGSSNTRNRCPPGWNSGRTAPNFSRCASA